MTDQTTQRGSLKKIKDTTNYYPHQVEGVRDGARRGSFLLADEMGLGKTLQTLTIIAIDFERGWADRAIIVTPASLKWNWQDEIELFTNFTCHVLDGTPKQRSAQLVEFADKGTDILVVNYEQVIAHLDEINKLNFQIAAYDEAHYLKSHKSKRSKAAHAMNSTRKILLTGSPLLNQVNELWSLLYMISPAEFPNYWRFVNRYCNTPEAPVWMADGTFKPIGKIQVGDEVMGWVGDDGSERRRLVTSVVERVESRQAPDIIRATMESGRQVRCTPDHVWLSGNHNPEHTWTRINGDNKYRKGTLSHVVELLDDPSPEQAEAAAWLSGIYDGEASRYFIAQDRAHNLAVWQRIGEALDILEIPYSRTDLGYSLRGGRNTWVKLLNWGCVVRDGWLRSRLQTQLNRTKDTVVHVEHEGPGEVVSMQTSTGNYVVWGFASRNCVFGGYKDKQIVGVKNSAELQERIGAIMIRRLKKDVLSLPDKQHIVVRVDLHDKQKELYQQAIEEFRMETTSGSMDIENPLTKFLRLKMVCGTTAAIDPALGDHSNKLDRATEIAEEIVANNEPVVIFTQFRAVQECMIERLANLGIPTWQLHGDVPKETRADVVKAWAASSKPGAIVCMLQVAGVGLNMTAANKAIFLDKLFVPKLNEQAEDRLHRIGAHETKPVQIFEIVCRKTVEQRIETIIRRKQKLFDTMVETNDWKKQLLQAALDSLEEEEVA